MGIDISPCATHAPLPRAIPTSSICGSSLQRKTAWFRSEIGKRWNDRLAARFGYGPWKNRAEDRVYHACCFRPTRSTTPLEDNEIIIFASGSRQNRFDTLGGVLLTQVPAVPNAAARRIGAMIRRRK